MEIPRAQLLHIWPIAIGLPSIQRISGATGRFISTTFDGANGALEMPLSYMALAACSLRMPEVVLVFVGAGGEVKTLLLCDTMQAVWGAGQMNAPPSIFQTPEEFR